MCYLPVIAEDLFLSDRPARKKLTRGSADVRDDYMQLSVTTVICRIEEPAGYKLLR